MTEPTQRERMATLENQMLHLTTTVNKMDAKLSELVSLKDSGRGVFWFAAILWGSGIIGGIAALWQWAKA